MSSLLEVRDRLAAQIVGRIPELTFTPIMTGNASLPALIVAPVFPELDYYGTFGRNGEWGKIPFRIAVALNCTLLVEAANAATEFVEASGPRSIFDAVDSDMTLDGLLGVQGCYVRQCVGISLEAADPLTGPAHMLVAWDAEVTMPKES